MPRLQDDVRTIVAREGLILRRNRPELRGSMERLLRSGELVSVLPGPCSTPEGASRREVRVLALAHRDPDAVLVDRTAAQLTFWPGLPGDMVVAAVAEKRASRRGFDFQRRTVPPELVQTRGGLRMTRPALTALDLCDKLGGEPIDRALRTRSTTLVALRSALELTGGRRGNASRRALVLDSRDEPWSEAERLCHRLLRKAGIRGWKANRRVDVLGRTFFVDVAFRSERIAVEIDGRLHEDDAEIFENDRWRQNALVLDGWMILRFTWAMLRDHPEVVLRDIGAALAERRRFSPTRRAGTAS